MDVIVGNKEKPGEQKEINIPLGKMKTNVIHMVDFIHCVFKSFLIAFTNIKPGKNLILCLLISII